MDSLYTRIGGDDTVEAIVEVLYQNVQADKRLAGFFEGIDMPHQHRKFRMFLQMATDGPLHYSGLELRAVHAKVVSEGASQEHVGFLLGHLGRAMAQVGVAPALADDVLRRVDAYSDDALGH